MGVIERVIRGVIERVIHGVIERVIHGGYRKGYSWEL